MSATAPLSVYLFGPMRLYRDGHRLHLVRRHARWLLAYLLVYPQPHRREKLAAELWPNLPRAQARHYLSRTLWQLRHTLGEEHILTDGELVQCADTIWCDLHAFRARVHSDDLGEIEEAVALYTGDLLEECAQHWAIIARESARHEYLTALRRLVVAHRRRGAYARALSWAQRLVDAAPLQEWGHRELIRLHALLGDIEGARARYNALVHLLKRELGTEPTHTTRALYESINRLPSEEISPPERPPLVGREAERARLHHTLDRVIHAEVRPHVKPGMALIGPAGIGKTALLEELRAAAQVRGVRTLWVAAQDHPPTPLHPFQTACAALLTPFLAERVTPHIPPEQLPMLATLFPDAFSDLSPPTPPDANTSAQLLHTLVRALAAVDPLILIVDDAHLLDAPTQQWILQLLHEAPPLPLAIYLALRTDAAHPLHTAQPWLAQAETAGALDVLHLEPLPRAALSALARHHLKGPVHPRLTDALWEASGGVPGIAHLWLETLRQAGHLTREGEEWSLSATSPPTPPSGSPLVAWAQQYMNSLPPPLRHALQRAALFHDPITPSLWQALISLTPETPTTTLDKLAASGLLQETEQGFTWRQAALRDAVYSLLDEETKRRGHALLAEAYAKEGAPPATVLYHALRAEHTNMAVEYALRAMQQALERRAYPHLIHLGEEVLQHLPDLSTHPKAWQIYALLGWAYGRERDLERATHFLERARTHVQHHGTPADRADVLTWLARVWLDRGDWDRAAALAQQGLAQAHAAGDILREGTAREVLAHIATLRGHYEEAHTQRVRALHCFREERAWHKAMWCLNNMGVDAFFAQRHEEALRYLRRSEKLMEHLGETLELRHPLRVQGHVLNRLGRYPEAEAAFARAIALDRQVAQPLGTTWIGYAYALLRQGHFRQARHILEQEASRARRDGNDYLWVLSQWHLGTLAMWQGNLGQARATLEQAWQRVQEANIGLKLLAVPLALGALDRTLGNLPRARHLHRWALHQAERGDNVLPHHRVGARVHLAATLLREGFPRTAYRILQQAHTLARAMNEPPLLAEVALGMAATCRLLGRATEAQTWAQQALEQSVAMHDVILQIQGHLEMAAAALMLGNQEAAQDHAQRGIHLSSEHGVALWTWYARYLLALTTSSPEERRALLHDAVRGVERIALSLPPEDRELVWACPPVARLLQILGCQALHPRAQRQWVHLPAREAPNREIPVLWTVHAGPPDGALRRGHGKSAWQRKRILRLVREATAQGAAVPPRMLAETLGISPRTVRRHVQALERAGLCRRVKGYLLVATLTG